MEAINILKRQTSLIVLCHHIQLFYFILVAYKYNTVGRDIRSD